MLAQMSYYASIMLMLLAPIMLKIIRKTLATCMYVATTLYKRTSSKNVATSY